MAHFLLASEKHKKKFLRQDKFCCYDKFRWDHDWAHFYGLWFIQDHFILNQQKALFCPLIYARIWFLEDRSLILAHSARIKGVLSFH